MSGDGRGVAAAGRAGTTSAGWGGGATAEGPPVSGRATKKSTVNPTPSTLTQPSAPQKIDGNSGALGAIGRSPIGGPSLARARSPFRYLLLVSRRPRAPARPSYLPSL